MSVKLHKRVEDWWYILDYDYQIELMENEYPGHSYLLDVEEKWNGLNWEEKYQIYVIADNNNELTEEEKKEIIGDRYYHEKAERGLVKDGEYKEVNLDGINKEE